MKVLALVDRDSGKPRTMVNDNVKAETLMPMVISNVAREARISTDEHSGYRDAGKFFVGHGTTSHSKGEYVNLEPRYTGHAHQRPPTRESRARFPAHNAPAHQGDA